MDEEMSDAADDPMETDTASDDGVGGWRAILRRLFAWVWASAV